MKKTTDKLTQKEKEHFKELRNWLDENELQVVVVRVIQGNRKKPRLQDFLSDFEIDTKRGLIGFDFVDWIYLVRENKWYALKDMMEEDIDLNEKKQK